MEDNKIDVLDHGIVRLCDHMGSDLSIVRAARVSYDAEWRAGEDSGSDKRLIGYLMKNRHTSPFEMVSFVFEIKAPIFVFRQWHRHRVWSYNEQSARYSVLTEEFYIPAVGDIGVQHSDNKQMRQEMVDEDRDAMVRTAMREQNHGAFKMYHTLLEARVPRELARSVLPVSTYSHMFAKVDLHNLFHFLGLRLHEHAQKEIRVYAEAMLDLIEPHVPCAVEAFKEYRL